MLQRLAKQLSKAIFAKARFNLPTLSSKYQLQNLFRFPHARNKLTPISYNHNNYAFDFLTINQNSRKFGGSKTPNQNIKFGQNFRALDEYKKHLWEPKIQPMPFKKIDTQLASRNRKKKNKISPIQQGKIAEKKYVMKMREQKKVFGRPYQKQYLLKSKRKPKNNKISILGRFADAIIKNKMGQTTLCLFESYNHNNYAFDFLTISQNQHDIQLNFVELTISKNPGYLGNKIKKFINLIINSKQSQQLLSDKYTIEIYSELNSKQYQNVIEKSYRCLIGQKHAINKKQHTEFAMWKDKYIRMKYSLVILGKCETGQESSYITYDKINIIFKVSCRV